MPFDRNSQPAVGRTPAPRPGQQIGPTGLGQGGIHSADLFGHLRGCGMIESLRLDVDNITDGPAFAAAQAMRGTAKRRRRFLRADGDLPATVGRHHRTHLQEKKFPLPG